MKHQFLDFVAEVTVAVVFIVLLVAGSRQKKK